MTDSTNFDSTSYDSDSSTQISFDSDGDGFADTTIVDADGDGVADMVDVVDPHTGAEMVGIDTDGDGQIDTVIGDADGDGHFDAGMIDTNHDGRFDETFDPNAVDPNAVDPTDDGSLDPFDQTTPSADDDNVHGDPMAEIPYHQAQASDNDCLPTSVAMVLSEVTGNEVPAEDVVDLANSMDLLGPNGMSIDGGVSLLEHYGVDAQVETGSLDDLRGMLDAGTPVIIGLDADDLYGQGDQPFSDDLVSGHAVVITGIDDEAGVVYINDPGFPDGAGVAIPIDEFEDAWTDADHQMIVASGSADDAASTDTTLDSTAGSAGNVSTDASFVLLPVTVTVP